jgi:glutaredoxin
MMNKITLFTMKGCFYCEDLKEKLNKNRISYRNKDINEYPEEYDKISNLLETDSIPIISVNGIWLIPGIDFDTIDECVEKVIKMIQN